MAFLVFKIKPLQVETLVIFCSAIVNCHAGLL